MKRFLLLLPALLGCLQSCNNAATQTKNTIFTVKNSIFQAGAFTPPRPDQKPKTLVAPNGDRREDPYYWLNERDNPAVRAHLEAENRYADSVMAPAAALRDQLFQEMKARIKEDDDSVPYFKNDYWYYVRFEAGKEYPIYCRKKGSLEAPEQILLNVNDLAAGQAYCAAMPAGVSPDNRILAYIVDYTGRNLYRAHFLNLETATQLPDSFEVAGAIEWYADSRHVAYDTKDPVTLRNDKIWRHKLGDQPGADALLYEEKDETSYAYLSKSKSEQYLFVSSGYTENIEWRYLDAHNPQAAFTCFKPREKDFVYDLDHHGDRFLIRTNWQARNFRLLETPVNNTAPANWKEILPHREDALLSGMDVFEDFLALSERKDGLQQIRIIRWADRQEHYLDFGEPTYSASIFPLPDYRSKTLRYNFSSLKTPSTTIDYDMDSRAKTVRKVMPVLGGFESGNYETAFVWAPARDGARVPISLVYRKGVPRDGQAPCLLIGYGSYGFSYDPAFQRDALSLLDRGFVVGIAHIRGGMEMGYRWYEDGKMMKKMNTFNDFIDCADYLCKEKYTAADRLFASGRSAGGLLMGAIANLRPDLFKGIVSGVPFVDVLTTMSDPSIPLTTGEYSEWGNPAVPEQYAYMKTYSPYDNLQAKAYPNMLILTSFADSQVQYFEPAKYVARLRDLKTDDNLLLFHTNFSGSHGGSSGRFERLKERAMEYAWMVGLLGGS
jgi:oligopeptidase B